MKNICTFILILLIWLLGFIFFKYDPIYYNLLKLPSYTIKPLISSIIWIFIYILISYTITKINNKIKVISNNDYFFIIIINYLSNLLFPLMFYKLKSPFLGFIINLIIMISSIYLFIETKKLDKNTSYFLIPYIIFSIYNLIISLNIWIFNF